LEVLNFLQVKQQNISSSDEKLQFDGQSSMEPIGYLKDTSVSDELNKI
jgi:hypothetical protein